MSTTINSAILSPITLQRINFWRGVIDAEPTALAVALEPLAQMVNTFPVLMRYRHFREKTRTVVEVCPPLDPAGEVEAAMREAGFQASSEYALHVEADNVSGLGYAVVSALAEARVETVYCVSQVVGQKYIALLGFTSEADIEQAESVLLQLKIEAQSRPSAHTKGNSGRRTPAWEKFSSS
jgi:hypothetical protein